MNSHLDIGHMGWGGKLIKLPEQGSSNASASSFQQYLNKNIGDLPVSPEKMSPDAIRTLAAFLLSAMDRASMNALFFDTESSSRTAPSSFLSTDLFMAMRNNTVSPITSERESSTPTQSVPALDPVVVKPQEAVKQDVISSGNAREQFAPIIARAAGFNGLDPKLIEAVIQTESDFNPQVVSHAGAQGLMQLMPGTAADLGVTDPFNPEENIQAGSRYLKQLMDRYDGDEKLALAAYNWGMGNLERHPERMPEETVNYVAKITGLMNKTA
ncbi:MAG: lytic transglycosylase domain-containing protein [Mariprofundaceae bacterium]